MQRGLKQASGEQELRFRQLRDAGKNCKLRELNMDCGYVERVFVHAVCG